MCGCLFLFRPDERDEDGGLLRDPALCAKCNDESDCETVYELVPTDEPKEAR